MEISILSRCQSLQVWVIDTKFFHLVQKLIKRQNVLKEGVLLGFLFALRKYHKKATWGRKDLFLLTTVRIYTEGLAKTEEEVIEECCLLGSSSWLAFWSFAEGWHQQLWSGWCYLASITNQENDPCIASRTIFNVLFLFFNNTVPYC